MLESIEKTYDLNHIFGSGGVDLLFTSAYKYFGPHVGVAFGRAELLDRLTPTCGPKYL